MKSYCRLLSIWAAAALLTFIGETVTATPYASCISVNNGTVTFHLNESGGNVTVTYGDGTTNSNFNGITAGTNLPSGPYRFSLDGESTYSISVFKVGNNLATLSPNVIQDTNINTMISASNPVPSLFVLTAPRGVAVNQNPASPYFGRMYVSRSEPSAPDTFLYAFNSDGTFVSSNTAGVSWNSGYSLSPDNIAIAADDSLIVADGSMANAGVWKVTPDLSTNQLLLGPAGDQAPNSSGQVVHGEVISPCLFLGFTNNRPGRIMWIDADYPGTDPNALLICTNVMTNSLPYETPPLVGPEIGLDYTYLGNVYPGLCQGPNGYIYVSEFRSNYELPDLDIYDATGTNLLWESEATSRDADYFVTQVEGDGYLGLAGGCAVSPDGNWLVGFNVDNHFTICQLTNGIPNVASFYTVDPSELAVNARAICFDAADNIYAASSGEFCIQEWTLGLTVTAVTTGDAHGVTGFQIIYPDYTGGVTASNSVISQSNGYGNPTAGGFVITLNKAPTNSLTVNFTLSGTAFGETNDGVSYPATFKANPPESVIFEPGQTAAVVTVMAAEDSIPRPTTTLTITLQSSLTFLPTPAGSASINILNTAPQELFVSDGASSMYNAFPNDYCSLAISRWGDINAAAYTVQSSSFTFNGGTAAEGVDFTVPSAVTINPGDLTDYSYIYPLKNGQLPVHTNVAEYAGNKTIAASLTSGTGYTAAANTNTLTIIDSANPPATVLYFDPLTNSAPENYHATATDLNYPVTAPDYYLNFGYNLLTSAEDVSGRAIPFPPNGQGYALRVTANKDASNETVGSITTYGTAVNIYPTNVTFGGNFAVRFNMNVTEPSSFSNSGSYEGPLFGIDCSGKLTNWWANASPHGPAVSNSVETTWAMDGIWVWLTDAGNSQYNTLTNSEIDSYMLFSGPTNVAPRSFQPVNGANIGWFVDNFKPPVFTSTFSGLYGMVTETPAAGMPCNGSPDLLGSAAVSTWADVEIKQYGSVVTLSIDKTPIMSYINNTPFTNGCIMLGYDSPVFGTDGSDGAVYYSNLQVVRLTPPAISGLTKTGSTLTFNFTTPDGSVTTSSFQVEAAASLNGPYTTVSGAAITQLPNGSFQATVPVSGSMGFYRLALLL